MYQYSPAVGNKGSTHPAAFEEDHNDVFLGDADFVHPASSLKGVSRTTDCKTSARKLQPVKVMAVKLQTGKLKAVSLNQVKLQPISLQVVKPK